MTTIDVSDIRIDESWKEVLADEFARPYFSGIKQFLRSEKSNGKKIYPPGPLIFNAFNQTPFDKLKVVIIGQDPYHGPGQAMGLSFSVPRGMKVPASLKNIYKELNEDVGFKAPEHGDLSEWAKQGVFLLNAILTVEHRAAASHRKIGWQQFTDAVIKAISDHKKGVVFLLWGNFARSKKILVDEFRHYVLESPHPSPLAGKGFFGQRHFSKTNELLIKQGKEPVNWQLNT